MRDRARLATNGGSRVTRRAGGLLLLLLRLLRQGVRPSGIADSEPESEARGAVAPPGRAGRPSLRAPDTRWGWDRQGEAKQASILANDTLLQTFDIV